MRLPFLDREREIARIQGALDHPDGSLVCLYGRRRLGKSRLIQRLIEGRRSVSYYVCDERDAACQRTALAREVGRQLPGFDNVTYPSWESLLQRWSDSTPGGSILALDEFSALVASSPELPSLLQKLVDRHGPLPRSVILCGSSQRMMLGLLLDASSPLWGRAREIIRLEPMCPHWLSSALRLRRPAQAIEHYAVWGGVPRYWELAADC